MAEDPFYELRVIDETENLHFIRASGTTERVNLPDVFMSSRQVLDGTRRG
jgi:hypothetical protein